jgi:serine/threonine-protein kinase RsbW
MTSSSPVMLTITSDLALLPTVRSFVESLAKVGGLDQPATEAIVLAANEAVSNVIRHAHAERPDAPVHVQCTLIEGGIEVYLLDEGEHFDLACVPHLDPSELRVGGRGVFLMRAVLDELTCYQRDGGGNVLRMVKRCPGAAAPPPQAEGL